MGVDLLLHWLAKQSHIEQDMSLSLSTNLYYFI